MQTETTITKFTSLDVVLDEIHSGVYDSLRKQLGNLRSLTIRGALILNLGYIWRKDQQVKWFPSKNLTNLQLIHCACAYAPHIPHVVQVFPALRTLFIAGCGSSWDVIPPRREAGWSIKGDTIWKRQAPLESIRLECMAPWEVIALGVMRTNTLIITAMDPGTIEDAFRDEEIYPGVKILRTEPQYKRDPSVPPEQEGPSNQNRRPNLAQICAERAITIVYDVKALMFPR